VTTPANTSRSTPAQCDGPNLPALLDTITKADTGDADALDVLRDVFRDAPQLAERLSGLAYNAEDALLANVPAGAAQLFRQQSGNLRRELAGEGTGTALERILIRRIALDFIATMQAERARAPAPGETRSLDVSRFYDTQADRAHHRFLAAVEALARVRKLITPIQINIAEQQVNVASNVVTGKRAGEIE
jgi:hypothetical protein